MSIKGYGYCTLQWVLYKQDQVFNHMLDQSFIGMDMYRYKTGKHVWWWIKKMWLYAIDCSIIYYIFITCINIDTVFYMCLQICETLLFIRYTIDIYCTNIFMSSLWLFHAKKKKCSAFYFSWQPIPTVGFKIFLPWSCLFCFLNHHETCLLFV